jgi:cell division protein ZapA
MSPSEKKTTVTVRIAGEEHVLRSRVDPEYTQACARMVDERIQEVRRLGGMVEPDKAAILAALSIADRYFQAQGELDRLRRELTSRSNNLARRIDEELAEGAGK